MAPPFPDPPQPAPLAGLAPLWSWGRRAARGARPWRRLARRLGAASLAVAALLLLVAWALPPLLDWDRFRTAIAAIAASRLGRPVLIDGDVTLRLLPEAILTAADVTLPAGDATAQHGDGAAAAKGISARVGALRLQVAIWPLLTGRIVLRDLVLSSPVVTLPWPLPDAIATPVRPTVPHPFAAHVENGTLRIGDTAITGIVAAIHGGPETAATPIMGREAGSVAAFGAEGFAAFAGRTWRFTSALGAPDADGVSALDLAVQGLGEAAASGAVMQGTLADGVVQGHVHAAGPDLSQMLPGSQAAWRIDAPFLATGAEIESHAIGLLLGGQPAQGELVLRLAKPARLDARVHAPSLDLDGWADLLASSDVNLPHLALPVSLEVGLDQGTLRGGTVQDLHAIVAADGTRTTLRTGGVTLPGGTRLGFTDADLRRTARGLQMSGPARLDATDLRATLAWLRPLAPAMAAALPPAGPNAASLQGNATLDAAGLAVSDLSGQIDGSHVTGKFAIGPGERPRIEADLVMDRLQLDDWLGAAWAERAPDLAAIGREAANIDATVKLRAGSAPWHGGILPDLAFTDLVLNLRSGRFGLSLTDLSASLAGTRSSLSGSVGTDGSLKGARFAGTIPDAAAVFSLLPQSWHWAPGLWHGPASLNVTADGPAGNLAVQVRAEAGDLLLEAELTGDARQRSGAATITLRHPGAPRLLTALGLPGSDAWLDTGSLAVLAHVLATPGRIIVQDFTIDAARLRLAGQITADLSGPSPAITGSLRAEDLPLPALRDLLQARETIRPFDWLRGWAAHLHLTAGTVEAALRPAALGLSADLDLDGPMLSAEMRAALATGGRTAMQLAIDAGAQPPLVALRATLAGGVIDGPMTGLPLDLLAGQADASLDLQAAGQTLADLIAGAAGTLHAQLRDGQLSGADLAALTRASLLRGRPLRGPARRQALPQAVLQGSTSGLSGDVDAVFSGGQLIMLPSRLMSGDGDVTLQGRFGLRSGDVDAEAALRPSSPDAKLTRLHIAGPWRSAHASLVRTAPAGARPRG